ncbi:LAMP3 protein, partial [Pterocles burchelli]|nr:LAMP3 protein [Pterocles burchelli]
STNVSTETTPAATNTTVQPASTNVSTEMMAAATNTTTQATTPKTQTTAAALTTMATSMKTVKPTTGSGNRTTAPKSPTTRAVTNTTTVHPGTQTTIPSTTKTVRPTAAPRPPHIPTGTYTVSKGNMTCLKAVMGLQLMALNTQKQQMEYTALNPNTTETSGSCRTTQAELNITFSGGFINFLFVK